MKYEEGITTHEEMILDLAARVEALEKKIGAIDKIPENIPRYLKLENDELIPCEPNEAFLKFEEIDSDGSIIYRITF